MMPILGVCGRKGGSGKTTTAIHLAGELAARGLSVEVVDCDDQGSASHWARPGRLPVPVRSMPLDSVDRIEAWSIAIKRIRTDCVVLDSPPHLGVALGGVVGLSDLALIPCGPSGLDLAATAETVGLVREIRAERDGRRPQILLVPNRTDWRTLAGRDLRSTLADLGEPVAPEIRARAALSAAFNTGQWIGSFAPNTPAHKDVSALAECVLGQFGMA
jgi:chromosome partitioning protein